MARKRDDEPKRRSFGQVTKQRSGRYQARYTGPDGKLHNAPSTFEDRDAAVIWLDRERRLVEDPESWEPPKVRAAQSRAKLPTLGDYAPRWLAARKVRGRSLAERTRDHYEDLLDRFIYPTFRDVPLKAISPEDVAHWYDTAMVNTPTYQAHAYSLLRAMLATAADPTKNNGRPLIPYNPCGIRGGGSTSRARKVKLATAEEVATMVEAMPEEHRLLVLLADGCGLRFGELAELRRGDIDTKRGLIRVRRAVVRTGGKTVVRAPKSDAGVRDVPIPPHLLPAVREHLLRHAASGKDGLLFPAKNGGHLNPSTFYGRAAKVTKDGVVKAKGWGWYEARRAAGREDLRLHDLRHGALTEAARHGATLAELMALAGHSTTQASQRYQHAASDRLAELARKRSEALGWTAEGE